MDIRQLKERCNKLYSQAIDGMEKGAPAMQVRHDLLDAAQTLLEIGKSDHSLKTECDIKAKKLLGAAKGISSQSDFNGIYLLLTGNELSGEKVVGKETIAAVKIGEEQEDPVKPSVPPHREQNRAQESSLFGKSVFNWDERPSVSFDDVAGLDEVKETVKTKVLLPLKNPALFEGYTKKNGGGILLYGPPGTGKTMIAAAIAHEINAKFCSIGPSDLLTTGVGNSEKLIAGLFREARAFPCSVIFFDEFESLCPVSTHAQHARQIRSELLKQMQGLEAYGKAGKSILLLIGATNKPWDVDPAFVRPGRLGTRIYVDLPDLHARQYMIRTALEKIRRGGCVAVDSAIGIEAVARDTDGYNGADMTNLIEKVQEISILRAQISGEKIIKREDFEEALKKTSSSVQKSDIARLEEWKKENG